jgi:hypothetical protein
MSGLFRLGFGQQVGERAELLRLRPLRPGGEAPQQQLSFGASTQHQQAVEEAQAGGRVGLLAAKDFTECGLGLQPMAGGEQAFGSFQCGIGLGWCHLLKKAPDQRIRLRPDKLADDFPLPKGLDRRDAAHPESNGKVGAVVDVHLRQPEGAAGLDRRPPASAPACGSRKLLRPEITTTGTSNDRWMTSTGERLIVYFDDMFRETHGAPSQHLRGL